MHDDQEEKDKEGELDEFDPNKPVNDDEYFDDAATVPGEVEEDHIDPLREEGDVSLEGERDREEEEDADADKYDDEDPL